jgi:hypothetical protein
MTQVSSVAPGSLVYVLNQRGIKCHYKLHHLKCAMAGAYGKYYEEIFGTHFYQTLLCLNCEGYRSVEACVLYKRAKSVSFKYVFLLFAQC